MFNIHSKNVWWWVGGVLIIVGILVGVGLCAFQSISLSTQNRSQISVTTKNIQTNDGLSKLDIDYPFISGVPQSVNDKIQEILTTHIDQFKKIVTENEQARIDTNKLLPLEQQRPAQPSPGESWYALYIRYTSGHISADTVSVIFFVDEYSGGAHGNKSFIPFNYDIVNNKELTLADVFAHEPNYLQRISRYAYEDITKQLEAKGFDVPLDTEWIQTGTAPTQENFSNFTLGESEITFYIPPYQVAAYAYGDFQVIVPMVAN
jgi:hypothetical protein